MCPASADLLYAAAVEQLAEDEYVGMLEDLLDDKDALVARTAVSQHTETIQRIQRGGRYRHHTALDDVQEEEEQQRRLEGRGLGWDRLGRMPSRACNGT